MEWNKAPNMERCHEIKVCGNDVFFGLSNDWEIVKVVYDAFTRPQNCLTITIARSELCGEKH